MDDTEQLVAKEAESLSSSAHTARQKYERIRGLYEDFARSVASVLERCLAEQSLSVHSITSRAKYPDSFERKAALPSATDPLSAKYKDPMEEITDKAGVRITTYFLKSVEQVSRIIEEQFHVTEKITKINSEPDRLGYQSIHYLVGFSPARVALPEYKRFSGLTAEIQVRTILQHAWAEIEHDIQYKASSALPTRVRRRFASLAGLIEIADREFQAIDDENQVIISEARRNVDLGQLDQVEITPDSLRAYLNKKYSPDRRMSDFSYRYTAEMLNALGFINLAEIDECVEPYDDDALSRIQYGSRLGQLSRFEEVLLASMGEYYLRAHPWTIKYWPNGWYPQHCLKKLGKLQESGIPIGSYKPSGYPGNALPQHSIEELKRQIVLDEGYSLTAAEELLANLPAGHYWPLRPPDDAESQDLSNASQSD